MQTNSPLHYNTHHNQIAHSKERMTGSSPVSPASSPASSAGGSPAHVGSLTNDSLDGPATFASSKLQPAEELACGLWVPDLGPCNQAVKGQAWDKAHAEIAEQAKHEAKIEHRIAELRREGLWSLKRLNRVQEAARPKSHWDYLCEEMQWLSADFAQERRWKRGVARKVARTVLRFHEEQRQKEEKAKRDEQVKLRRIAASIAKDVKQFWTNVEKVVQFKQQSRLEEKRKKALDLQLDFIVGQTEKYSDLLSQSLNESLPASKPGSSQLGSSLAGSAPSTPPVSGSATEDEDFQPHEEEDDEETIEVEEKQAGNDDETRRREIELLRRESELPLDELLRSLPAGLVEQEGDNDEDEESGESSGSESSEDHRPRRALQNAHRFPTKDKHGGEANDEEFTADEREAEDEEETIEMEEALEGEVDHKEELDDLAKESEMPVEDLLRKYTGAFSDSFETPDSDSDDSSDSEEEDDETTTEYEEEEESSSSSGSENSSATDEDEEEDDDEEDTTDEDIGVEYLIQGEDGDGELNRELAPGDARGPKKEITDIAAAAESLQPKGYTLATTQVKTPVPSLLRGTLREYQHIGLDWLVTMYEKKLNGILADEMGLGKTIQTIALLAHLAIEKCNWGPHLIIVPTSVMLNWEMEFKRWCPSFKILTYYGVQKERKLKRQGWTKPNAFHVCITSYKLVLQDHQAFRRKNWKYMILDEAQNIKNFKSQRWQSLLNFNSQRRLLLTGTPLQNSLMELWSLMHFLMPHVFQSHREFKEWFSNPLTGMIEGSQEYNENLVKRLHKVLRPFLLRRIKVDVEKQMPKKYEHVVQCRLSKRQRYLYDDFMSQASTKETLETGHFMSVINILMQLRKVCNHPNLFDPRPIHSPFITRGICYTTASCVVRALEYQPFKQVDLSIFDLINIEGRLSRYESEVFLPKHTVTKKLIEEIADAPDPPPRPKPVRMKVNRMLQPNQKPDGRTVLLVNSPRPPAPAVQSAPQPQPRPSGGGVAELLHTVQGGTASLQTVVSPVSQTVIPSQGLSTTPLSLPLAAAGPPRTVLAHSRPPVPSAHVTALPMNAARPFPLSALRVAPALQQQQPGTAAYTVQGATASSSVLAHPPPPPPPQPPPAATLSSSPVGLPQRFVLSPDLQARLPTGEVVSIGQLASLANQQSGHPVNPGSKPVTFQIQGNKLTLAGAQVRQVAVGQPRQLQGNMVHLVSTGGHHIIGQPAQLALIQAMAQQTAQPAVGIQTPLQTVTGTQSAISTAAASPGLAVPIAAAQVPASVVTTSSVVKIVVRQAPKEGFPLAVHSPRPLAVSAARFPATVVSPGRVQLPVGALTLTTAAPRPVLRVLHTPPVNTEQAAPTVTRLVVSSPNQVEKEDCELPTLRPVIARPVAAPTPAEPVTTSTSLAALRPRRHQAQPVKSPFKLEALEQKRRQHRQARLERIVAVNDRRCAAAPVYGSELLRLCAFVEQARSAGVDSPPEGTGWRGLGYAHCLAAQVSREARQPEAYWRSTRALGAAVHNPEERLEELADIIDRFIFVIPPVEAPAIQMHVSHPHPSSLHQQFLLADALHREFSPRTSRLHRTICNMRTQFPDLRLIQYDCGKLQVLDVLLRQLKMGGHRVLLFTQMTRMLDILEQFLNFHGHIYLRLDGSTKVEQRQILMDRFNADKRIFCFILSTRSGGVGVNLTGADTVLFYDSDWNPTMDAQAQDRCHRIGQTRDVHIYRLISDRTVEENILKKANQKRMLGDLAIEGGNFTTTFFKEQTIRELFDLPAEEPKKELAPLTLPPSQPDEEDSMSAKQTLILEQALCRAEDEEDIQAASQAKAEQVAELAEFNENIPLDGEDSSTREDEEELSKAEQEIAALVEQLTPIERYAMNYLEASLEAVSKEELKQAEEQVEAARKDLDQAKDEVWKWTEDDENRLNEELRLKRQKKARHPPKAQGERLGTRTSERLRGARKQLQPPREPSPAKPTVVCGPLSYEDPVSTRDLQIHISAELPEELFEDEPPPAPIREELPPPDPAPQAPPPPPTAGPLTNGHSALPQSPANLQGMTRQQGAVALAQNPPFPDLPPDSPWPEELRGQRAEGELPLPPNPRTLVPLEMAGERSEELVSMASVTLETGGEGSKVEESLPVIPVSPKMAGERSEENLPGTVGTVETGGGRSEVEEHHLEASVTVETGGGRSEVEEHHLGASVTVETGGGRSEVEEHHLGASVTVETGGGRSQVEEHHLGASVTVEMGSERSEVEYYQLGASVTVEMGGERSEVEEDHLGASVTVETGGERSGVEEHYLGASVTVETGGERSEEDDHFTRTLVAPETGGERLQVEEQYEGMSVTMVMGGERSEVAEHLPRTLVSVETGGEMSQLEDRLLTSASPEMKVERLEVTPLSRTLLTAEAGGERSLEEEEEEVQFPADGGEQADSSCSVSPAIGTGSPVSHLAPCGVSEPVGVSRTPSPSKKLEPRQLVAPSGPGTRGRGRRPRRTADQDLVRGPGVPSDVQLAATVLRKVPGRVNVIVERREPAKRPRRVARVEEGAGQVSPPALATPGPRRSEAVAADPQPCPAKRRRPAEPDSSPRPGRAARSQDRDLRRRPPGGALSPSPSCPPPPPFSPPASSPASEGSPSPPVHRSTRQRPGCLMPPLERRRYKPRGRRVPAASAARPEAPARARESEAPSTSHSSSSSSSPSPSPSPPTSPDRFLRSLAAAAKSPAANTRSAGSVPAPPPPAKRKGRPPMVRLPPAKRQAPGPPPSTSSPLPPGPAPRRGRPPKIQPRRGRPPKARPQPPPPPPPPAAAAATPPATQPRRPRGRPPSSPPKRRGRPPHSATMLGSPRPGRKQQA